MTEAPRPRPSGRSWALWKRLAEGRPEFGKPDAFFGEAQIPLSRWVTFTVTDTGAEFIHRRGDPGGDAAAPPVRPALGRNHGVIDLRALQHALRQQHLAAP